MEGTHAPCNEENLRGYGGGTRSTNRDCPFMVILPWEYSECQRFIQNTGSEAFVAGVRRGMKRWWLHTHWNGILPH